MREQTGKCAMTRVRPAVFAMLALVAGGCGDTAPQTAKDDEAMKRALKEGTRIEKAAASHFYPKKILNYFEPMDSVSTAKSPDPQQPVLPDQLLDLKLNGKDFGSPEMESAVAVDVDPLLLNESEILGRNTWMMWCAGNEGFWDWLATDSLGFIDLLKLIDSRKKNERFRDGGLINEPKMAQAGMAAPGEFGLWLDLPEDPQIRAWRRAYVSQAFQKIGAGKHKSQIGLKKRDQFGYADSRDLYVGDPMAFKDQGYDYPSSYLSDDMPHAKKNADGSYQYENPYDEQIPPPDIYGISSGVVGLRLFPNPYFDQAAQKRWNAEKYYTDKSYSSDPTLVRPYRVGVSCAYCHASFHPLKPPRSVTQPEWANISGNIGAQYLRIRVAFGNLLTEDQFIYHLLDSQPPGTIDTSLIASDNINNPNTMNAVFNLPQRALLSFRNPPEKISAASRGLPALWQHPEQDRSDSAHDAIPKPWQTVFAEQRLADEIAHSNDSPRYTPRVLLDGSDSIGGWGALARVFLNIGSYWEQWNQIHQPVLGFTPQSPFRIRDCETHSVYWNATKLRVGGLRDYFLKVTPPMPLVSTADGDQRIVRGKVEAPNSRKKNEKPDSAQERARHIDIRQLARGRRVFARNCIVCHSSIQPESSAVTLYLPPKTASGENKEETEKAKRERWAAREDYEKSYETLIKERLRTRAADAKEGEFWEHDPGQWLSHPDYQKWAAEIVNKPEFWKWNYLSTDYRIPVTLVGTNSARAMATNALTGHLWEDFASEDYRSLPSPGAISYFNPFSGKDEQFTPRHKTAQGVPTGGGGPGFYRVPSLVSIWATAPFLHNNSLGLFTNDPSVDGRLAAFDDSIRKLLWPERRLQSSSYNHATAERLEADHGLIWRTPVESHLTLDARRVPYFAKMLPWVSTLYMKYSWLQRISPLWLPSAIFFVGSLLILLVSNSQRRHCLGYTILAATFVLWLLLALSDWYPQWQWLSCLRQIEPNWLPVASLFGLSITLLLPLSNKWRRYIGYLALVASVGIGGIVYFNAGKLGDLSLGPIPKGTPVNLLANFNSEADRAQQIETVRRVVAGLAEVKSRHLQPSDASRVLKEQVAPALMEVNKCPDFVMDKGHDFEWFHSMTDDDKNALIELLKTF